ncbi:hypothetical protein ABIF36_007655 [Bradyrhizobium japonicum]
MARWLMCLARMKRNVLPHVAQIGRDQDQPLCAAATQRLCGEQQGDQLVVGLIERGIEDGGVGCGRDRDAQLAVREAVQGHLVGGKPKPRRETLRRLGAERQGLERDHAHDAVLPGSAS